MNSKTLTSSTLDIRDPFMNTEFFNNLEQSEIIKILDNVVQEIEVVLKKNN